MRVLHIELALGNRNPLAKSGEHLCTDSISIFIKACNESKATYFREAIVIIDDATPADAWHQ